MWDVRCVNVGNPDFFLLFVYGLGLGGWLIGKLDDFFMLNESDFMAYRFGKMAQTSFFVNKAMYAVINSTGSRRLIFVQRMPLGSPLFSNHLQKIKDLQGILSSFLGM